MEKLFNKLLVLRTPGIGPVKYNELIRKFGDIDSVALSLSHDDKVKDLVNRELEMAQKLGVVYLTEDDALYPKNLRELKNHPPVISIRGNISVLKKQMVGMVGTRHATGAGIRFMSNLAESFAKNDFVVVSGMAMGTDTAAHRGALAAPGDSQTIAVLAGGVDNVWPLENERLYNEITERGAVISEMPIGMTPMAKNFIQRNHWIAGLSDMLILGEADLKSGSMTTAGFAIEYNRQVWAIPSHPLDSRAAGPNSLIKDGLAKLCSGQQDFFDLDSKTIKNKNNDKKNETENDLLDKLGVIPVSESVLAELVKKSISEIKSDLVVLELQGLVAKQNGGYVKL